ncbi:unnamed protein product [Protopolystoma xenopodis]|uniref:Uncharacterized protein n=1 Tax=Protopolystoma xenopodis TaxID=117903 RepID=A0A3S5BWR1_9PLAT|nr:unnamed protein product [Protopolystoma xenopodis]
MVGPVRPKELRQLGIERLDVRTRVGSAGTRPEDGNDGRDEKDGEYTEDGNDSEDDEDGGYGEK